MKFLKSMKYSIIIIREVNHCINLPNITFCQFKIIFDVFDQAREHFYNGDFEKARMLFASIAEEDKPAAAYEKKCKKLISQLSEDSTLENWKGIWVASSK